MSVKQFLQIPGVSQYFDYNTRMSLIVSHACTIEMYQSSSQQTV